MSQLSLDHVLEIYQIRMPLECMAARIAAETIDDAQLEELERLVETEAAREGSRRAAESLGVSARFHEIIVACTRNRRLAALWSISRARCTVRGFCGRRRSDG